jgi:hypothetical protein
MQAKHGDEVTATVSQTMDLLKASNTQSLANSLLKFLEYQKCLQQFNDMENEHKDLLRQQRFGLVAMRLKECDMASAKKLRL